MAAAPKKQGDTAEINGEILRELEEGMDVFDDTRLSLDRRIKGLNELLEEWTEAAFKWKSAFQTQRKLGTPIDALATMITEFEKAHTAMGYIESEIEALERERRTQGAQRPPSA